MLNLDKLGNNEVFSKSTESGRTVLRVLGSNTGLKIEFDTI